MVCLCGELPGKRQDRRVRQPVHIFAGPLLAEVQGLPVGFDSALHAVVHAVPAGDSETGQRRVALDLGVIHDGRVLYGDMQVLIVGEQLQDAHGAAIDLLPPLMVMLIVEGQCEVAVIHPGQEAPHGGAEIIAPEEQVPIGAVWDSFLLIVLVYFEVLRREVDDALHMLAAPSGAGGDMDAPCVAFRADCLGIGMVLRLLLIGVDEAEAQGVEALAGVATGDELSLRLADIAVVVKNFHKSPRIVCVVNGIALGVAAILDDAGAAAGADIDATLHVVVPGAVLRVLQDVAQLVQRDLQAVPGVPHDAAPRTSSRARSRPWLRRGSALMASNV